MEGSGAAGPFVREALPDVLPQLVATARGDEPATLVIRNGRLVNVCSGEILDGISVAVRGSRIAYVGYDASHTIGPQTQVIDADGRYIAPGFLDGHCHIESSQLTVSEFARAVLPLGTTGGFFDAHEIVNVLGLAGLRLMVDEARTTPLLAYMQVASCVPASSDELETAGAKIGPEEVAEAMRWGPDVIALGEVMNFPGVVHGDPRMLGEIAAALRAGRVVDGHFTWPPGDRRLAAYAAAGVSGDHEVVTAQDVIWRVRHGMYAKMRRGSAWHDVAATVKAHTEAGIESRFLMLVTDDRSPESLLEEGHMDFVVRHAIQQGVRPITAFQMATLNTAQRFGVAQDAGSITPGRYADIILLDGNLADVRVCLTIAAGRVVAADGKMLVDWPRFVYPPEALHTVHLDPNLTPDDFVIPAPGTADAVTVRVIRVQENSAETKEERARLGVRDGRLCLGRPGDPPSELCKLAVIERHGRTGSRAFGLVSAVGFRRPAAIAMTVAHDSHNLMILGNSDALMALAGNEVIRMQGGVCVAYGDTHDPQRARVERLPLPVAGLMSTAPFPEVAAAARRIGEGLRQAGCTMNYAFMTLSLLALVVLPELHLSDKGLVRITPEGFARVGLIVESSAPAGGAGGALAVG